MQEMQVWSLGREDPLEKGMATHTPVFLPGASHGRRSLVGEGPWGSWKRQMQRKRLSILAQEYTIVMQGALWTT